jgi:hypothetical protein
MNKRIVASLLLTFCLIPIFSQSWDEVRRNTQVYLSGEGWGATVEEADQQALAALISKISVAVSSEFSITEDERTTNGVLDSKSYTNSKLQTYSSSTLTNTERIVIDNNPDEAHIGRYIKRSELNKIFEGRIRTIKEYIRLGKMAEEACKIDDALRNYYWAYSLLKSVQHPASVTCTDEATGETLMPLTWLPQQLTNIMKDLSVTVTGNDGTNVDLMFKYKGQPVSTLDFTYFDGRNWSNICSVKDGRGSMEFVPNMIPENVQINYEYAYRGQAHINQEIQSVLSVVKGQAIRAARVNVQTGKAKPATNDVVSIANVQKTESLIPAANAGSCKTVLEKVVNAIKRRNYDSVRSCFTDDGWDMFTRLVRYGNARLLNANNCEFSQMRDNVIARSIQMSFSFKRGLRKEFVEDVVFTFDKNQKIDCIAFGLDRKAKEDIMRRGAWTPLARQTLMQFLENYKTAYALKRLDYLKTIFDDDAVIIVGHVAEKMVSANKGDMGKSMHSQKTIKRVQYSKDQYMKNLEACFRSNEFVNIRFANNDVRRAKSSEEYGIQIKQDYYSTNYGDQGYLYLQVDLEDPDQPVIKVRTWQPEPDPEIGLFGIGNW